MNFGQSFRLALKSLTTSKMRSLLTMLGIIIGVASVIVILALGNGVQGMVDEQVEKLGVNMMQTYVWGRGRRLHHGSGPGRYVPAGGGAPRRPHRRLPHTSPSRPPCAGGTRNSTRPSCTASARSCSKMRPRPPWTGDRS